MKMLTVAQGQFSSKFNLENSGNPVTVGLNVRMIASRPMRSMGQYWYSPIIIRRGSL